MCHYVNIIVAWRARRRLHEKSKREARRLFPPSMRSMHSAFLLWFFFDPSSAAISLCTKSVLICSRMPCRTSRRRERRKKPIREEDARAPASQEQRPSFALSLVTLLLLVYYYLVAPKSHCIWFVLIVYSLLQHTPTRSFYMRKQVAPSWLDYTLLGVCLLGIIWLLH